MAVVVLAAVALAVARTWHSVGPDLRRMPAWAVLASVAFVLLGLVPTLTAWRILLSDLGSDLALRPSVGVFFVGQLGKYLPGSLWVVLAQSDLAARHGVPRRRTAVVALVQVGISIVVGLALGVLAVPAFVSAGQNRLWLLAIVALPIGAVILYPAVLNRVVAYGLRVLRREPLEHDFSGRAVIGAAVASVVAWVFIGLHLWVLAVALHAPVGAGDPGGAVRLRARRRGRTARGVHARRARRPRRHGRAHPRHDDAPLGGHCRGDRLPVRRARRRPAGGRGRLAVGPQ